MRKIPGWVDEVIDGVTRGSRHIEAIRLVSRWYEKQLCMTEVEYLLSSWNKWNEPPLSKGVLDSIMASTTDWEYPHEGIEIHLM